jgi:hypothetical protein
MGTEDFPERQGRHRESQLSQETLWGTERSCEDRGNGGRGSRGNAHLGVGGRREEGSGLACLDWGRRAGHGDEETKRKRRKWRKRVALVDLAQLLQVGVDGVQRALNSPLAIPRTPVLSPPLSQFLISLHSQTADSKRQQQRGASSEAGRGYRGPSLVGGLVERTACTRSPSFSPCFRLFTLVFAG